MKDFFLMHELLLAVFQCPCSGNAFRKRDSSANKTLEQMLKSPHWTPKEEDGEKFSFSNSFGQRNESLLSTSFSAPLHVKENC